MGDKMKKIWLIVAIFLLIALSFVVKSEGEKQLICDENGNFTILVVSDPQCDTIKQWNEARNELETLVNRASPKFVLINGDINSKNIVPKDKWKEFISVLENRGIYWSTTNGNHDPFDLGNYKMYVGYNYCINTTVSTVDKNYDDTRPMNYVLPIYSNDQQRVVFAIYGMDSGTKGVNGYEGLTTKQIDWYKAQSDMLKVGNGGKAVTSILCMHLPLPQTLEMYYGGKSKIYGVANEINFNLNGYVTKGGKTVSKINVHTSNIDLDNKMFETILNQCDIKGVFFGHNHRNNFIGSYNGVLLGFVGKLSTGCYSDMLCRGGRVIKFNQSAPESFTTEWLTSLPTGQDQPPIHYDGSLAK